MGKTKTAFVSEPKQNSKKSSEELYREKKARQEAKKPEDQKIHVSGLKGGQRVKIVSAEEPTKNRALVSEEKAQEKTVKTRGQKYLSSKSKIKEGAKYKIPEAIKLVKETSYSKFDGSMELHIVIKKTGTNLQITLPFSNGKAKKIEVADEQTLKKLGMGKIDFDILLATTDMMPKLVPFAKILGPRGLMPNPKSGTIIKSAKEAEKFGGNSITLKTEKDAPLIHTIIGKVSQKDEELTKNIEAVISTLNKDKLILRAFLKATMSPSVKLQLN